MKCTQVVCQKRGGGRQRPQNRNEVAQLAVEVPSQSLRHMNKARFELGSLMLCGMHKKHARESGHGEERGETQGNEMRSQPVFAARWLW